MGQAPSLSDFPQVKQSSLHTSVSTLLLINRKRKSCLNARGREFAFPPFPHLCRKYKCMSDTELPRVQVVGSDPSLPHPVTGHHSTYCDSAFQNTATWQTFHTVSPFEHWPLFLPACDYRRQIRRNGWADRN